MQKRVKNDESSLAKAPTRSGFVAVLGKTNAGKSTLINQLVGQKVSIVSRKVQTTLSRISGIAIEGNSQIILVDTPGFISKQASSSIEKEAWSALGDTEHVLYLYDCRKDDIEADLTLINKIKNKKISLVLNKIDKVKKEVLLSLADNFYNNCKLENVFMISALTGSGVQTIKTYLAEIVPEGEWIFPEDEVTDASFEKFTSEITREHIYHRVHKEIPYECKVITEESKTESDGALNIKQVIYVKSTAHKMILVGHKGEKIKAIGTASRRELCELFGKTVHLFLDVVVEK